METQSVAVPASMSPEDMKAHQMAEIEKHYNQGRLVGMDELQQVFPELVGWLRELTRWAGEGLFLIFLQGVEPDRATVFFYTENSEFRISARLPQPYGETHVNDPGYLGGRVSARRHRAGEWWNRGNDLKDGPYTGKTWLAILNDIVAWELRPVEAL